MDLPRPKPTTMRDVARAAGVSPNAVSLALREHPSISAATRKRIQETARQLGYELNPMLSALMRRQRAGLRADTGQVIAFLTFGQSPQAWKKFPAQARQLAGVSAQAAANGFRCEPVWADDPKLSGPRLSQILATRGIRGLVIGPLPEHARAFEINWSEFAAVAIGRSLKNVRLDRVSPAWFHACTEAFERLETRGYRRIGLVLPASMDERTERAATAVWATRALGMPDAVPPFRTPMDNIDGTALAAWCRRHKPDVLLTQVDIRAELARHGVSTQLAFLSIPPELQGVMGIRFDHEALGATAVDHLAGLLLHNRVGLPTLPREILLEGVWQEAAP